MSIVGIDHVQLAMPEGGEDQARAFCVGVLGFTEVPKPANLAKRGGVWFSSGNVQVHLGVEKDFRPARKAHPAFRVDHLAALRAICVAAGYTITEDEPLPGHERFYVNDPFGNRIELVEPSSTAKSAVN
jgi:catechol 2,3-dioxygenase-like lactoylglutathione lyase family enzyme